MRTVFLTVLALLAFAGNSILCRLALGTQSIDAGSFTVVRLLSGVVTLVIIVALTRKTKIESSGSWAGGFWLFAYAICFSYAYISLATGTGALILFGAVQISILGFQLFIGKRFSFLEWLGIALAIAGFAYLMLPSASQPSLIGFALMAFAGLSWGMYTLAGKGSKDPLADTQANFMRTLPFAVVSAITLGIFAWPDTELTERGLWLAIASGSLASGLGYTLWYMALGGLSATMAAILQLLVPVIAAIGGILFMQEPMTLTLIFSALLILGGILLVFIGRDREPA